MDSSSLPVSALPEIREVIDSAERILKADISRKSPCRSSRNASPVNC
jgi:hypothetical protein